MLPIGPGGLQSGFSTLRYVRRAKGLSQKKIGSADSPPAPPGGPPALGCSLEWRAEGLPSTRNWPFRWPLSPTSPPQVTPKAKFSSRPPTAAGVWYKHLDGGFPVQGVRFGGLNVSNRYTV
jgi:hypothetical protein